MTNEIKKYCEGLDCAICDEKEPCIYKIANELQEKLEEDVNKQLDQLKKENEELKRYKSLFEKARDLWNEASKTNYKLLDEIEDLKDSLKRTICQSECYRYKEAEKLKQTLIEIKEIANSDNHYFSDGTILRYEVVNKILQKISEVEK